MATGNTFMDSYARLFRAQKTSVGVSYYSRWINRPIGRVLASAAHVLGLTPNAVTGLSALCSLGALVLLVLAEPSPLTGLGVGLLLVLGFAFDSADGQLARLRGGGSRLGEWLDHLVDSGKTVLVHTAVLLAAWLHWDVPTGWLLVPLAYLFVAVVQFSGILLTQFLLPKDQSATPRQPSAARSLALLPADYGVLCLAFLLSGAPAVFTVVYTVLGALTALVTAGLIAQWARRLRAA
ncbi:CDP-alcohol phosphatidyltransferase family protein [Tessaracoccus lacteus]|uniref:CDP-alcohol phosphatidyltransferase family protein n=1 Tax=Tessaracoccus lacteus TaxID=3041766 RepID=A0ABY8PW75_9ACTN|nr:CDP-alcohol phosphatidyltransferase family protein [Tessaracoccus sp. T21]WGT46716.1 CDP-alcohol phosphatidyltransferase family protein [Tessaracoccus sp. T21]